MKETHLRLDDLIGQDVNITTSEEVGYGVVQGTISDKEENIIFLVLRQTASIPGVAVSEIFRAIRISDIVEIRWGRGVFVK